MMKVPHNTEAVSHTWQVGPSVVKKDIIQHDLNPDNLNAKGTFKLIGANSFYDPSFGRKNVSF